MATEKWECNLCGHSCRVEIDFDETGETKEAQRFRELCIVGTKLSREATPEWQCIQEPKTDNGSGHLK